tara:strand:+ start:1889 stop:3418 length:1530 start_codon:yes stop_codon:yes gene_type:complete
VTLKLDRTPIMILGTSSGAGKSLMSTAICRLMLRRGEKPLPFKGQNMSNNAWVDQSGGEMAYSQAVQAWAAGVEPINAMNPILLKPKGDQTSEVIYLGESVGVTNAENYYKDWFESGWSTINIALKKLLQKEKKCRLILEGAGSPVEVNLQHKDLTNLKLATLLKANCILVADIERGGVFAQLIGTLELLKKDERSLIKGIIINRFRGNMKLFEKGKDWIEKKTGIPVLGIMPWLNEIFPAEDSLDLLERRRNKVDTDIEIAVIKLPYFSNYSDIDPIEAEPSVKLTWIKPGDDLKKPDGVIIPGSKQTIKDLEKLHSSGLSKQLVDYGLDGGIILGICGGMQMLGRLLKDPENLEDSKKDNNGKEINGLNLMPFNTIFKNKKYLSQRNLTSNWPEVTKLKGFELHHGETKLSNILPSEFKPLTNDSNLGWVLENKVTSGSITGTYLHGILDNGEWRRLWINQIRKKKGFSPLSIKESDYQEKRENLINLLTDEFEKNIDIARFIEVTK